MQSKAMETLDNLDKNPATGMGKKVSTVQRSYILVWSTKQHIDPPICVTKNPKT